MSEDKRAIEAGLARRFGMEEKSRVQLAEFNEAQADWTGACTKCGAVLTGTLQSMKEHRCDSPSQ